MAEITDLLGSKKVKEFVRKGKSRPWTVLETNDDNSPSLAPTNNEDVVPSTDQQVVSASVAAEIEAKPSSNRGQTEAKLGTELRPIRGQTEAEKEQQESSKSLNRGQTEAKPRPELRPHSRPNRGQTEAKLGTELRPKCTVFSLDGLQREILLLIFNHCKRARAKQSPPIAVEHISKSCKTTYHAARKAIQRLEQKEFLKRTEFKVGRSGWTKYEIPDAAYQELLQNETEANSRPIRGQTEDKPGTELRPEPRPSASSSSSSLRSISNKELLTTEELVPSEMELDARWQAIDSSPITELRFGRSQIAQIAHSGRVSPEQLQDSIYAFAYDLSENQKAKSISGAPLNYFMGILRKGPYVPPANYESPEERQQRLYLEAKEQQYRRRQEREARLETVEFEEWVEKLSVNERAEIVPPNNFAKPGGTAHTVQLREYFRENIWPALKERSKGVTP